MLRALRVAKLASIVASVVLMTDEPPTLVLVMFAAPNTLEHAVPL